MALTVLERIRRVFLPGDRWPPEQLREVWEEIERFEAFRQSDEEVLRLLSFTPTSSPYMISPVPRMISRASANLLVGEPPEFTAAAEADQQRLDFIVEENMLDTELHRSAMIASSEGEVWGRICYRPDLLDVPLIEFVSRRRVIPYFAGRFLLGATFVTEWQTGTTEVHRLFEHYERGAIIAEVFRGTNAFLGTRIDLNQFEETAGMPEVVYTGFDQPLVAFVPNSIDTDPDRGFSDYQGLEDRFLGINRATTIGDTNTEIAGKKRALVDSKYVQHGRELTGDEVWVRDSEVTSLDSASPLQMIDFNYDATQITTWLDHLIDSTLGFSGTSPQIVGRQLDGAALSGIALRLKMVHSLLEQSGKGRFLDRGVRRLLHFAQVIDSRGVNELGFGRPWSKPDEIPAMERQDALPHDDMEAASIVSTLVGSESISFEERVAYLHPEWDEDQRSEEVSRLKKIAEETAVPNLPALPTPNAPAGDPALPPAA